MFYKVNTENVYSTSVEGRTVVYRSNDDCFFSFEGVSQDLWFLISDGVERTQIEQWLVDNYNVSRQIAQRDVEDFLQQLFSEHLIEVTS